MGPDKPVNFPEALGYIDLYMEDDRVPIGMIPGGEPWVAEATYESAPDMEWLDEAVKDGTFFALMQRLKELLRDFGEEEEDDTD
jgi:hypothetical protein